MSQMRKDIFTDRWVIVADGDGLQPTDFHFQKFARDTGFCPFCEGNEAATPTEVFAIRNRPSAPDQPGWSVALYTRVSTIDQHPETQLLDLRRLAEQRGFEIVREYTDRISGAKAKRPGLDQMLTAAHRREFDVVLVWAADRLARSVRHFLEVLDTLNHLGIEFVSFRENLDTGGPLGRAVVVIVSAVAELERNLIIERVRAGLRRARLEGRQLGRRPIEIDRVSMLRDRARGLSLAQLAKAYGISRTSVARALKQAGGAVPKTPIPPASNDIATLSFLTCDP